MAGRQPGHWLWWLDRLFLHPLEVIVENLDDLLGVRTGLVSDWTTHVLGFQPVQIDLKLFFLFLLEQESRYLGNVRLILVASLGDLTNANRIPDEMQYLIHAPKHGLLKLSALAAHF